MTEDKISIPQQAYKTLTEIIIAYTLHKDSASIDDISKKSGIRKNAVTLANSFLMDMGIIQGQKGREKRIITERGSRLGKALKYFPDDVKNSWVELI